MTHTYVVIDVGEGAFNQIAERLRAAGYDHAFYEVEGRTVIDMHGLAIRLRDLTECTGISASWCPIHGDCSCPRSGDGDVIGDMDHPDCPLHRPGSEHGDHE